MGASARTGVPLEALSPQHALINCDLTCPPDNANFPAFVPHPTLFSASSFPISYFCIFRSFLAEINRRETLKGALQIQIELITQLFTFVSGLEFEGKERRGI